MRPPGVGLNLSWINNNRAGAFSPGDVASRPLETPHRRTGRRIDLRQTLLREGHPIYSLELSREETSYRSVDEIVDYFRRRIDAHRYARFIAVFDHYAHTRAFPEGIIGDGIRAAKNVVFCFGITLPDPHTLALRPRSVGIAETDQGFLVTFMEAPMPLANAAMEDWAKGLRTQPTLAHDLRSSACESV
jgi:hypothetical protein